MLVLNNISKKLGGFELKNVSFSVDKGDYFVLLGESGVGKSILLELITGLMIPENGSVLLNERDITRSKIQNRKVGLVYQDQSLFPHLSVRKNISYPMECKHLSKPEILTKVTELAESVGVTHLLERDPDTLSIGEAQRVAIARTLATKPEILLLDEPLASLDVQAKSTMRALLRKINNSGQTIVHVTHDYEEAIALAKKIAVMEKGSIVQEGTPEEVFRNPKSEFIANFIGIKNFYRGTLKAKSDDLAIFKVKDLEFEIATKVSEGKACIVLRSEDITISQTEANSSARNNFEGTIVDLEPAKLGVEVIVDIGVKISALITKSSLNKLQLVAGQKIWINFKASSVTVIESEPCGFLNTGSKAGDKIASQK